MKVVEYYLNSLKNKPNVSGKVCVMGLGYIGLPTAALLANRGYEVVGVDVKRDVVEIINSGKIHIKEPGLDTFVKAAVQSGKLKAYIKPKESDVFIIAVPTPFYNDNSEVPKPNIEYVLDATNIIAPYLKEGNIVILESTSPVGTTEKITNLLKKIRPELFKNDDIRLYIAHCPERVLPGRIMKELIENDRIVGGINKRSSEVVADFYRTFVSGKVLTTDAKTAELCKLVENSYRDVNIAFANELSIICDKYDIDVWELRELANRHPRVNILFPGVGVGGHCIAVDPWFIVSDAPEEAKLIKTAREVNNYKTEWVIEKIKNEILKYELENRKKPKVALMGLAFKPDIDDLRESPALYIARKLNSEFDNLIFVEPNIEKFDEFEITDYNKAIEEADIIVFLVAHKEFRDLDVKDKKILDFCGAKNQ